MFEVNEVLLLTNDAGVPDSFVIEVCENFVPELKGFYVCLTKECIPKVSDYIKSLPYSSFITKTFEDDAVNGLQLLLSHERKSSYTEEFVKVYGGIENLLLSYSKFISNDTDETTTEEPEKIDEPITEMLNVSENTLENTPIESEEDINDFVDDSIFSNTAMEETTDPEDESSSDYESNINLNDMHSQKNSAYSDEMFLMVRAIATKLGIIEYDDAQILSKSEMHTAQAAIRGLAPLTVQEAVMGALALAESKEDLASVTRFLELFYSYLRENNLN